MNRPHMREAVIQLSDRELEAMGLADVVQATREAGLRDVTELVCHGTGGVLQVRVEDEIPPADLDRFEAVEWWERLHTSSSGEVYLCKVVVQESTDAADLDEHATMHELRSIHESGVDVSVVGSQEEINESVAAFDEAGVTPLLHRLTDFEGSGTPSVDSLTDRQREVLETAYSMGYYEIPRSASTEEVAEAVGLDPSTVAEHLQRAEHNVMGRVLESTG
ncbi:MAG: helix-turn-helix domain-containing protein [Halodesulfurarchaeum sp.]